MSDEPLSSPPRVPVTAEFLAEVRQKQAAYTESRRRYRERFNRHSQGDADELDEAEAASISSPAGMSRRRSRGKTHDPRQLRFEV